MAHNYECNPYLNINSRIARRLPEYDSMAA